MLRRCLLCHRSTSRPAHIVIFVPVDDVAIWWQANNGVCMIVRDNYLLIKSAAVIYYGLVNRFDPLGLIPRHLFN